MPIVTSQRAGTYPTGMERGSQMLHHDFDFGSSRERVAQMRTEVEHNRLEARLAKAHSSRGGGRLEVEEVVPRRGRVARGAAVVAALFR